MIISSQLLDSITLTVRDKFDIRSSISYNELNYKLTFAVLRELMEPDEFLLALEALNRSGGAANTAKRVIRNIYVLDNLLR